MQVLDFILSMKVKSWLNIICDFKWKDKCIDLKSSFQVNCLKKLAKMIFFTSVKNSAVFESISLS